MTHVFLTLVLAVQATPTPAASSTVSQPDCNRAPSVLHIGPAFLPPNFGSAPPAVVDVTVDDTGTVTDVRIVRSTSRSVLDQAALATARGADYAPGENRCKLAGGTVRVTINFEKKDFNCDRDVTVQKEFVPGFPRGASTLLPVGTGKDATVKIEVDASGELTSATIFQSTGIPLLDAAALNAARQSTYIPKMVGCRAVPADVLFKVSFFNNGSPQP